jgi:hypothetical protein
MKCGMFNQLKGKPCIRNKGKKALLPAFLGEFFDIRHILLIVIRA